MDEVLGAGSTGVRLVDVRSIWPLCGRCRKPVLEVDVFPAEVDGRVVIHARCHGEVEEVVVRLEDLLSGRRPRGGVAFTGGREILDGA